MRKLVYLWILTLSFLFLAGCALEAVPDENTLSVDKKGKITCTVVEDFGKGFYDAEELQGEIEKEIEAYNKNFSVAHLELKTFEVEDGVAKLQTSFDEAKYYVDYSGLTLFVGSVAEAEDSGYDLSGEYMDTEGSLTDFSLISDVQQAKVLVLELEEAARVVVPGKIICASRSGNVQIVGTSEAMVEEKQQACILYK